MRRALALAALLLPLPALASDSGIGLSFAEVTVTATRTDTGVHAGGHLTGDFRITGNHGLQLDVRADNAPSGLVGRIEAHLYMAPQKDRKYGLFLSLTDVDGREATVAEAGIAGMLEFAPGTVLSGHAVLGYARPRDIDFIAGSARLSHALSDDLSIFAEIGLAEFDEAALRAVTRQARVGVVWEPPARAYAATFAIARDEITGRDARPAETRAELALTFRVGAPGGARRPLLERPFAAPKLIGPLIAAGLF